MIKLDDSFYIRSDGNCYIVCKYLGKNKKNEDTYDNITYHRTLKDALSALIKQKQYKFVVDNDLTLQEAIEKFKQIEEETEKCLKKYIKEGEEEVNVGAIWNLWANKSISRRLYLQNGT